MDCPSSHSEPVRRVRRLVVAATVALLLACTPQQSTRTLRLGHGLDTTHPVHQAMESMAQRLSELSGGQLELRLYPSEQLGSERELLELLQIGSVAMTKVSAAVLESFAPSFALFGLPYLFDDEEHQWRVLLGAIGTELLAETEPFRLRGLTYYDAGARSFYTRSQPVESPADLEGLKIRVQESPSAMALVRAVGAAPTPISWGELYTALQQGVVDGAENNPPSFYLSGHYEVCRHYVLDEHTAVPDVLLISSAVWSSLSEQQQGWLQTAASESSILQRELWRDATLEALAAVEQAGVTVTRPPKAPFQERVAELLAAAGEGPLAPWMRRIREAGSDSAGPPTSLSEAPP